MRKIREVSRLRYELKLGYQQIGRSCAIAASTVHKYLKRAEAVGLKWPLAEGCSSIITSRRKLRPSDGHQHQ